jgi:hypothetical protein
VKTFRHNNAAADARSIAPQKPAGALVVRTLNRRIWFSVNDRTGSGFKDNEGFFEFDVTIER